MIDFILDMRDDPVEWKTDGTRRDHARDFMARILEHHVSGKLVRVRITNIRSRKEKVTKK